MERLQAAIEKARNQRTDVAQQDRPATATAPLAEKDSTTDAISDRWQALRPLDVGSLQQRNRQIVTVAPNHAAAPFDILRTRIVQQAQIHSWKKIAIISPHSSCGKTLICANLAFSFARQAELRTILIDFDMRRGTLAKTLGQSPRHSMHDVIEGRVAFGDHALRHGSNLAVGLNGDSVENPSELLQSSRTREALAEIDQRYRPDLMLFDVPPLRATDDSIGFLRQVDAAIIIVAAEETPMSQIDVAERQVSELTSVMGVVLNKCRIMDGDYGYDADGYNA